MDSMIAKLRVALQLDSAAFESGANRAASQVNALGINMDAARSRMNTFSEGLIVSGNTAQRMGSQMRAVNDNAGAMRAGLQNAGFQLQDMAVQFASGQRAGTIFAQQLPQLAGALSEMAGAAGATSGILGRMAGFMAGPWGVAVGVGAAVLSPLIAKLFDTGDAAKNAQGALYDLVDAQRKLAAEKLKPTLAAGDLNKLRDERLMLSTKLDLPIPKGFNEEFEKQNRSYYVERLRQLEFQIAEGEAALRASEDAAKPVDRVSTNVSTASGRASIRSAGQTAGREYRTGFADELGNLQQTTNDILAKFKPFGDRTTEQFQRRDSNAQKYLLDELSDVSKIAGYTGEKITDTNRKIGESFFNMSQRAISSLQNLTNGIRGGDFLGTLSGILSVLESLGGMGLFGSKIKANLSTNLAGARANGGPVSAGRMYMVGERGPELFRPNSSGTIVPNHNLPGGGGNSYYFSGNLLTPEFWNQINAGHAVAAQAGGELGFRKVARAGSRRLA